MMIAPIDGPIAAARALGRAIGDALAVAIMVYVVALIIDKLLAIEAMQADQSRRLDTALAIMARAIEQEREARTVDMKTAPEDAPDAEFEPRYYARA